MTDVMTNAEVLVMYTLARDAAMASWPHDRVAQQAADGTRAAVLTRMAPGWRPRGEQPTEIVTAFLRLATGEVLPGYWRPERNKWRLATGMEVAHGFVDLVLLTPATPAPPA